MSYFDDFKTISTLYGTNSTEQSQSLMQNAFDQYFNQSPNRVSGTIDDAEESFIVQQMKYGENFNDEKIIILPKTSICKIGSLVEWDSKTWLVLNEENRPINTHLAFKMGLANNIANFINSDGELISEPCVIQEGGLGFQDNSRQVAETDARRKMIVRYNSNTLQIRENHRFVVGVNQVYAIADIDNFTSEGGVITFRVEKTQSMAQDDFVSKLAYNGEQNFEPQPSNDIQFSSNRLDVIEGYSNSVNVSEVGVPTTTFTFSIIDLPTTSYTILSSDGNSITIQCNEYYHEGMLRATSDSDPLKYAEIPIILSGLY